MIQNYDFDVLKIDMSFIRQIEKNGKVRKIIRTIISMCHDMGIEAVAEGVETKEELEILRDNDCDYIQDTISRVRCATRTSRNILKRICVMNNKTEPITGSVLICRKVLIMRFKSPINSLQTLHSLLLENSFFCVLP